MTRASESKARNGSSGDDGAVSASKANGRASKKRGTSIPQNPMLDNALTVGLALELAVMVFYSKDDLVVLGEFVGCLVLNFVGFRACKAVFRTIGKAIGTRNALSKSRNLRKFSDQSWQLVTHAAFSALEVYIAQEHGLWANPKLCFVGDTPVDALPRRVYIMQIATYFVLGVSHRFLEARHKDYFVMYTHHVVTLFLLLGSYWTNNARFGLLVLLIHDLSDVPADLVKMANYMGLDSTSGLYLTETMFACVLGSWAYLRLYLFPTKLITAAIYDTGGNCPGEENGGFNRLCWCMRVFLVLLLCMHVFWYGLFVRIIAKLAAGTNAHAAGREDYEGSSDSENKDDRKAKHA